MLILSLLCLLPLLSIAGFAATLDDVPCSRDLDCKMGHFCFQSYCSLCVPCIGLMNRQPPLSSSGESLCARQEDDCGECLLGYQAEDLVGGRRSSKCYPLVNALSSNPHDDTDTEINLFYIAGFGFLIFLLPIVAYPSKFSSQVKLRLSRPKSNENLEQILVVSQESIESSVPRCQNEEESQRLLENEIVVLRHLEEERLRRAVPIGNFQRRENVPENVDESERPLMYDDEDALSNDSSVTILSPWTPLPLRMYTRSISLEMLSNLVRPNTTNESIRTASSLPDLSRAHIRLSHYLPNSPPGVVAVARLPAHLQDHQDSPMNRTERHESYTQDNLFINENEGVDNMTNENNEDQTTINNVVFTVQTLENVQNQSRRRPRTDDEESIEFYLELNLKVKRQSK